MGIPLQQETAWLSMSWPFSWFMSKQSEIPPVTENIRLQAWNQPLRPQGKGAARLRPERQGSAGWEGQQRLSGHRGDQVCDPLRKRGVSRRAASLPSLLRTMGSTHLSANVSLKGGRLPGGDTGVSLGVGGGEKHPVPLRRQKEREQLKPQASWTQQEEDQKLRQG